jgi:hypothetical protein
MDWRSTVFGIVAWWRCRGDASGARVGVRLAEHLPKNICQFPDERGSRKQGQPPVSLRKLAKEGSSQKWKLADVSARARDIRSFWAFFSSHFVLSHAKYCFAMPFDSLALYYERARYPSRPFLKPYGA